MWVLMGFSAYEDPVTIGIGFGLFFLGIPVFFAFKVLGNCQIMKNIMGMCFNTEF